MYSLMLLYMLRCMQVNFLHAQRMKEQKADECKTIDELNEYLRRSPGRGWLEHQIANGENELARLSEDLLKRFAGPS